MKVDPQDYFNSRKLFINIIAFILMSENKLVLWSFYTLDFCVYFQENIMHKRCVNHSCLKDRVRSHTDLG